jgi:hypothetical protein
MRELNATRWRDHDEGFVVPKKIIGRRRCQNYLVRISQVESIEYELDSGSNPLGSRLSGDDFVRLEDSDYR